MKSDMQKKTMFLLFILVAIAVPSSNAQIKFHAAGSSFGIGMISGNSPQIFSSSLSLFTDIEIKTSDELDFRLQLIYLSDFNKLIPQNRQNKYYPVLRGGSVQLLFQQQMFKRLYLEEGVGPLILNDKTFSDVNTWNYGAVFSISAGIRFFELEKKGFSLALISELGNTFTQTTPQYLSLALQLKYNFY